MFDITSDNVGEKQLLLGNEAIVRGLFETGVHVATTYPGTPSSEIGDILFQIDKKFGIYFEYSINEKVALEVAGGAAFLGANAICSMKHVGLNVAADPLMSLPYMGIGGGLVIVSADDPGCHSSQNEQDNRYYAKLANIPMFEPSDASECKEMTKAAFDLSRAHHLPVLLRTTTRVNHMRSIVGLGEIKPKLKSFDYKKNPFLHVCVPIVAKKRHLDLISRMNDVLNYSLNNPFNFITGKGDVGIITSGAAYNYVYDLVNDLNLSNKTKIFKLGLTHPLPGKSFETFLSGCKKIIVVEELEPYLESFVKEKLYELGDTTPIFGKTTGHFPIYHEYDPSVVDKVFREVFGIKSKPRKLYELPKLPQRPPSLCNGCPHRATFFAIKAATNNDAVFPLDIGCYSLGMAPPLEIADYLLCMGASVGGSGGAAKMTDKPVIGIIGDSTFFHSGLTGLVNSVHNHHKFTLVIVDNRTTAMTGHQPHPGIDTKDTDHTQINLESIVKATGVGFIKTVDPLKLNETISAIEEAVSFEGTSVVISKSPCLFVMDKSEKNALEEKTFYVDQEVCCICSSRIDGSPCDTKPSKSVSLLRSLNKIKREEILPETPPCVRQCPTHICIPGYLASISRGNYLDAINLIREQNPLPSICGYVCHHPCELGCTMIESVSIKNQKTFLSRYDVPFKENLNFSKKVLGIQKNGKRVAVVGSGPAGLGAAFELFMRGYDMVVLEKENHAGGMLRYAIPPYRLPREVLDKDIGFLCDMGIKIKTNSLIDADALAKISKDYAAVLLGVGMQSGLKLGIKGENFNFVYDAIKYLKTENQPDNTPQRDCVTIPSPLAGEGQGEGIYSHVAVIGGGDSAIDAARTSKRRGATNVTVFYRRTADEMPARLEEILDAKSEGVKFEFLASPVKILDTKAVVFQKMKLGELDASGRHSFIPVEGNTFERNFDTIIIAIGQQLDFASNELGQETCPRMIESGEGKIKINSKYLTSADNIYAAGDCVTGPKTVVEAIAAGRDAAYFIDKHLSGSENVKPITQFQKVELSKLKADHCHETITSDQAAISEAGSCILCGTCAHCRNCVDNFACGAFFIKDGRVMIDESLCVGCGVCEQLCPSGAIKLKDPHLS